MEEVKGQSTERLLRLRPQRQVFSMKETFINRNEKSVSIIITPPLPQCLSPDWFVQVTNFLRLQNPSGCFSRADQRSEAETRQFVSASKR